MAAEGVDEGVEGLVGDRFLLEAAPLQDHGDVAGGQPLEEVLDQGMLLPASSERPRTKATTARPDRDAAKADSSSAR